MTQRADRFVQAALNSLDEAIQIETTAARVALDGGRFAEAREKVERVEKLEGARTSLAKLVNSRRTKGNEEVEALLSRTGRRNLGRLSPGVKTSQDNYRLPILKALRDIGGSGRVASVLDRVERQMASTLNEIDKEPLPSDSRTPRWRNAAQWTRVTLVEEGLLASDSPRGVWQITEQGRQYLDQQGRR